MVSLKRALLARNLNVVPLRRRASIAQWTAGSQDWTLGVGEDAVVHAEDGNRDEADEYPSAAPPITSPG